MVSLSIVLSLVLMLAISFGWTSLSALFVTLMAFVMLLTSLAGSFVLESVRSLVGMDAGYDVSIVTTLVGMVAYVSAGTGASGSDSSSVGGVGGGSSGSGASSGGSGSGGGSGKKRPRRKPRSKLTVGEMADVAHQFILGLLDKLSKGGSLKLGPKPDAQPLIEMLSNHLIRVLEKSFDSIKRRVVLDELRASAKAEKLALAGEKAKLAKAAAAQKAKLAAKKAAEKAKLAAKKSAAKAKAAAKTAALKAKAAEKKAAAKAKKQAKDAKVWKSPSKAPKAPKSPKAPKAPKAPTSPDSSKDGE